jgi:hypothetical protein
MKNDFLDDDWLKEELLDEYIHDDDDDFSFSVLKKIQQRESENESKNKRNFYLMLTAMVAIISFLFIPDLMTLSLESAGSAEGAGLFSLLDSVNEQQKPPFMPMEFIGLAVICLSFILVWSFEDFDLI